LIITALFAVLPGVAPIARVWVASVVVCVPGLAAAVVSVAYRVVIDAAAFARVLVIAVIIGAPGLAAAVAPAFWVLVIAVNINASGLTAAIAPALWIVSVYIPDITPHVALIIVIPRIALPPVKTGPVALVNNIRARRVILPV